jgi:hypothetical protein
MDMLNNPITAGEVYRCELDPDPIFGGCSGEYPAEDIVYIVDSKFYMCRDCYVKYRKLYVDNHPGSTIKTFDERAFFGPGDTKDIQPLVFVKTIPDKEPTIFEILKIREEAAEKVMEERRHVRDCENFRIYQREYMRGYMKGYTKIDEVKEKMKLRHESLKSKFKDSDVIDNTTPTCPRCEHPKCGKAGYVINTTGKYQRRRCPRCGYFYTDDWRV